MLALADFLDGLLRGAILTAVAVVLGGVAWQLWVLRPWQRRVPEEAVRLGLTLLGIGAVALAAVQALLLAMKAFVLSSAFGSHAGEELLLTLHFAGAAARILLALALALAVAWARRAPWAPGRLAALTALAALVAVSGAWLTHATGRLEHRPALMAMTALHQVGAGVWMGGLVQLIALWRLSRRRAGLDGLWAVLVGRFSRLAAVSVGVLVLSSLPLVWTYAGSVSGLVGTGYGGLLLAKLLLLAGALLLAAFNRAAVRRGPTAEAPALRALLPYLVEAEALILVAILFTAATLSAQPPAVDLAAADKASIGEVAEVFRPKVPSLRTPSIEVMRKDRAEAAARGVRSRDAYLWSNFSHNVAGLILLGMSLVALVGGLAHPGIGRHWPLGFIALAVFIYLRAAANEATWPFGSVPFWRIGAEGLQHRIAAALVLALGLLEWRARAREPRRALPYVFPALGAVGALLLLTHAHTAFQTKQSFLVQVTHTTMGALAVLVAAARLLELRLGPPSGRLAGLASSAAMLMIALVLVFYREANIVLPPD
jgi:putative copper resistance protein D